MKLWKKKIDVVQNKSTLTKKGVGKLTEAKPQRWVKV